MRERRELGLNLRSQELRRDVDGRSYWHVMNTSRTVEADSTALLICDMWDRHWSRGASERVDAMAPQMNELVKAARERGVFVIHAPSDTMEFYDGAPARERMVNAPCVNPPPDLEVADPPLPIDDSDEGSDTGEEQVSCPWSRQHPAIEIDQEADGISDNGREVYSTMRMRNIQDLFILGVHTNMCVLNRSFGIKQMVRWGVSVTLVRDLTDTMYNPAMPPYVSHAEGTRLVVEYIEKFWCPTVGKEDLLGPR